MPSSDERLRGLFMKYDEDSGRCITDGIGEAEEVIKDAGGRIVGNGIILFPKGYVFTKAVNDAIDFLVWEWDYGLEEDNTPQ